MANDNVQETSARLEADVAGLKMDNFTLEDHVAELQSRVAELTEALAIASPQLLFSKHLPDLLLGRTNTVVHNLTLYARQCSSHPRQIFSPTRDDGWGWKCLGLLPGI